MADLIWPPTECTWDNVQFEWQEPNYVIFGDEGQAQRASVVGIG